MSRMIKTCGIIVPAYNEEASLTRVLKEIRQQSRSWHIVVVDDGSTDKTGDIARLCGVTVIRQQTRMGVGAAVRRGFVYAKAHTWDIAIQIDADGEHDPRFVALLLKDMQRGVNVVIGSRFLQGTQHQRLLRFAGRRLCMVIVKLLFGCDIYDPTSGFRAFDRRAIDFLSTHYPADFPEPESLVMLLTHGFTVIEVPVVVRPRLGGKSSITLWKSITLAITVPWGMFSQYVRTRFL